MFYMYVIPFLGSERQINIFDPRNMSQKIATIKIDSSPSTLLPFYDEDTEVLFVAGKVGVVMVMMMTTK
jgi:hypothetical protein